MELSLGFASTSKLKNGSTISKFDLVDLNVIKELSIGKSKDNLPCLYCYNGEKGKFNQSNVFFVDIDTKENVNLIIENVNDLFSEFPNILFVQKSFSGKLHIVGRFNEMVKDENDYILNTKIYTCVTLFLINKLFGVDYYNMKDENGKYVVDEHSMKFSQALYFSSNDVYVNEQTQFCRKFDNKQVFELFPRFFKQQNKRKSKTKTKEEFQTNELVTKKTSIKVDKNFEVGGYSGNDLRYRITSTLFHLFKENEEKTLEFIKTHFTNYKEFSIGYDYGTNNIVKEWLVETFGLVKKHSTLEDDISDFVDLKKTIDKVNYSYVSDFKDEINSFSKCCVVANPGTGKSTFQSENYDYIIVSTNSIKNGAFDEQNQHKVLNFSLLLNDDVFNKLKQCNRIAIDEIHLITSDSDFRLDEMDRLEELLNLNKKIDVYTATISKPISNYLKGIGFSILKIESERKEIKFKKVVIPSSNHIEDYLKVFFSETNKVNFYCSNHIRSINGEFEHPYICRETFNNDEEIKKLCSKRGEFKGNYFASQFLFNGVDNHTKGDFRFSVRSCEINWIQLIQLSNRCRDANSIEVVVIDDGKDYQLKQNNYTTKFQKLLMEEKQSFFEHPLKDFDGFSVVEIFSNENLKSKNGTKTINKCFRNWVKGEFEKGEFEVVKFSTGLEEKQSLFDTPNILKEFMTYDEIERENEQKVLKIDNLTIFNQCKKGLQFANKDSNRFRFYFDNLSKIEGILDGTKTILKYENLDKWSMKKYLCELVVDWEKVDTSISLNKFLDVENQCFTLNGDLENIFLKGDDYYQGIFYSDMKKRLYNKKKSFELGCRFVDEFNVDLKQLKEKENEEIENVIFENLYLKYKDDKSWVENVVYNDFMEIPVLGTIYKMPFYNKKKVGFKYQLIGNNETMFKTKDEMFEYVKTNFGYTNTLNTFKRHDWKLWFK